jgi:hypothetical protein
MAATKDTEHTPQVPEAPHSEAAVPTGAELYRQGSDVLARLQTAASLNTSEFSDDIAELLKAGAIARYYEFAPADATDRNLATLIVGLQNATMTSLQHAAEVNCPDVRSQELRNAARAAKVVIELTEALDRHRGRNKQDVQVGQVTVESGGQAVVGNVNSDGRRNSKPEETHDPTDDPSGAEE